MPGPVLSVWILPLFLMPALLLCIVIQLQNYLNVFPGDEQILHLPSSGTIVRVCFLFITQYLGIFLI